MEKITTYSFVAYLVGLSAFGSFVNDMYLPTLPEMTRYFQCPVSVIQLGLTMGMLGLGIGQLILSICKRQIRTQAGSNDRDDHIYNRCGCEHFLPRHTFLSWMQVRAGA